MDILQTIILSIVEGISEFLPISSTGHLVLTSSILQIQQTEFVKSFEIFIQLGAIFAVIFLYRKTLLHNFKDWQRIIVAFIPTGILGFTLYKLIKNYLLGNDLIIVASLFIGGIVMILLEKMYTEKSVPLDKIENMSYKQAFGIGLIQSVSMIPGVSRSAATIIGGMFLGLKRTAATEFSFLLAIPTMAAATGLDLLKSSHNFSANEYVMLSVGFIGSFITALFAVKFLINFVKKNTFTGFGIYRIVLAVFYYFVFMK